MSHIRQWAALLLLKAAASNTTVRRECALVLLKIWLCPGQSRTTIAHESVFVLLEAILPLKVLLIVVVVTVLLGLQDLLL